MELLGTYTGTKPVLLYLKNYVLFKFQFGNIAALQVETGTLTPLSPTPVL